MKHFSPTTLKASLGVVVIVGQLIISTHLVSAGTNTYPAPWKEPATQDSVLDTWREYNRECTSYVAWMLHSVNGFEMPFYDDALNWGADAQGLGYVVDNNPTVGSVYWTTSHDHVAYVEAVSADKSTVTVLDYNSGYPTNPGLWNEHPLTTASASGFIHFHDTNGGTAPQSGQLPNYARSLVANGGFNDGQGYWTKAANTNFTTYSANNGLTGGTNPYEGSAFGATNAAGSGASIYQNLVIPLGQGNEYCVDAKLTTADGSGVSGGSGALNLYEMSNGNAIAGSTTGFSSLPNGNSWKDVQTCLYMTGTGDTLRVQLYPNVGSPTLGVDAVNVNQDLAANGGFNDGQGWWTKSANTNFTTYGANNGLTGGTNPYEGSAFGATNGSASGASIYQNVTVSMSNGQEYCASAQVTTADGSGVSGGSGSLNMYVIDNTGTAIDGSATAFSNLPNANTWVPVQTCVYATGTATTLRIQLYPNVGSPTLGVDGLNVNQDIAANGGFDVGTGWWSTTSSTNLTTYGASNGQTGGTNPQEGSGFGATNGTASGASIYQNINIPLTVGQEYCVDAKVTTADASGASGGSGYLNLYGLDGNGAAVDGSSTAFSGLPTGNNWQEVETCLYISTAANSLRVQLYPTSGGPTVGVDSLNVL